VSEIVIKDEITRERAGKILASLSVERPWLLTVEPYHERRTTEQNARLWLLHTKASQATGYAPEEMHEIALCRFFGFQDVELGGIKRQVPLRRSSQRNKKEFAEFMEATEAWYVSELGVFLE
jgi:hypothetical protein